MDKPAIIINAKVYDEVTGPAAVRDLAQACNIAAAASDTIIGLAPPQLELSATAHLQLDNVLLFAQHTDSLIPGSGTGWITAEAVKATGAVGSILNHAEHKISHDDVASTMARLHHHQLQTLVCADGDAEVAALAPLQPTYMAVEPPELIGGNISVTSADPEIVSRNASRIRELSPNTRPLCGAGIKTGEDVAAALKLGCDGVLLASGVVKAKDQLAALIDLCSGLPN